MPHERRPAIPTFSNKRRRNRRRNTTVFHDSAPRRGHIRDVGPKPTTCKEVADLMTDIAPPTPNALTPKRDLAGQPLFLHISDRGIDDDVKKAAAIATTTASVGIIAVQFTADPGLRSLVNSWLERQRRSLAAWRVQEGITGDKGRLSLRSTVATDEDTGSDYVWAYVQWDPTKEPHRAV
jgi:hypothetical protein